MDRYELENRLSSIAELIDQLLPEDISNEVEFKMEELRRDCNLQFELDQAQINQLNKNVNELMSTKRELKNNLDGKQYELDTANRKIRDLESRRRFGY